MHYIWICQVLLVLLDANTDCQGPICQFAKRACMSTVQMSRIYKIIILILRLEYSGKIRCMTSLLMPWTLYYNSNLTLSLSFQPMPAQRSMKAPLPLAKSLATMSSHCSNAGPRLLPSYGHQRPMSLTVSDNMPWASYQIRKIAGCACAWNAGSVFPATDFKGNR